METKQMDIDKARTKLIEYIHLSDGQTLAKLIGFAFQNIMSDVSYHKEEQEYILYQDANKEELQHV